MSIINKEYLELSALLEMLPFAKDKMYALKKRKNRPFPPSRTICNKVVWKRSIVQKWLDKEWEAAA